MKLRFWLILYCVCWWGNPLAGNANSAAALIEQFPTGQINWTRGVVRATGLNAQPAFYDLYADAKGQIFNSAFEQALQNIINTLMLLKVDDRRYISHLFAVNKDSLMKVEKMARSAKIILSDKIHGGLEQITVEMSLYGGFSQLMLPNEVRQVQPIKTLMNKFYHRNSRELGSDLSDVYTGLIVDARGIGAKPSMVPTIVDEKGNEVFGPAYVSREFAVQYGVCQYIRLMKQHWSALQRVAPTPLLVRGLRTLIPKSCNIVISNTDASKLRGTSTHLKFLKKCRVIIVLD